jgi:DNA-binding CsgD family transcriptional regulator
VKRRPTSLARGSENRGQLPHRLIELCRAGLDSVVLRRELRSRLVSWVPFDAYCVNTVDPETLVITSSVGDGLPAAAARRLFELEEAGHDFNHLSDLARGTVRVASMWQATEGDVARSQRMRELFQPLGWHDELRAALVVDAHCWGYLHLFRGAQQPRFSARDLQRMAGLAPLLGAALRSACLVGTAAEPARPPAVVLLDRAGELEGESEGAAGWLAALSGDVGGALPHVIHSLHSRSRSAANAGSSAVAARYRTPHGDWLSVHTSQLNDGLALLLGSASGRERTSLLFLAYGLTPREAEVAGLLLRGYANDAIAQALNISLYTAKDHVKAILAKTGAASRADFVAKLVA